MNKISSLRQAPIRAEFAPAPEGLTGQQQGELKKLKTLSKEYESFFMKQVVEAMRKTVPKNGYLNGGNAEEVYRSMMDDKLSEDMAGHGGSGIAENLYNTFSKAYLASLQAANNAGEKK